MRTTLKFLIPVLAAAGALAGCGSSSKTTSATSRATTQPASAATSGQSSSAVVKTAANAKLGQTEVTLTGAANTLVRASDGFLAYNTDYQAALESLLANMPQPPEGGPLRDAEQGVRGAGRPGVAHSPISWPTICQCCRCTSACHSRPCAPACGR